MADEEEAPDTEAPSAVDAAFSGMPGLRESMQQGQQPPAAPAETGEGGGDTPEAPSRRQVEDSEAVTEALNQIPGLRDQMGR
jgi:hypothetical protein